jgi:putative SOS response-associated peptidase YedK
VCGRFTLHLAGLGELQARLGVQRILITDWRPRYNIAPGQLAPVVRGFEPRTLGALHWGLIPHWAKSQRDGTRPINARVESIASRPSFREAFGQRRCIVPATGYFEWRVVPGQKAKQPVWIRPRDAGILALAGLWESWVSPAGEVIESFAIVTTDAQGALREIHARMPLELRGHAVDRWLRPGRLDPSELATLVVAAQAVAHLNLQDVDRRVGSPDFDEPICIAPAAPAGTLADSGNQLGLFD